MSRWDELVGQLASIPTLPGARCRGHHALFDGSSWDEDPAVRQARHSAALAICTRCPALALCADWLDSLPKSQRPLGVVAGRRVTAQGIKHEGKPR